MFETIVLTAGGPLMRNESSTTMNNRTDSTPNTLLDSAERLFAEKGWEAVSVREITQDAGANVAAIHYHFGNKEALLEQVLLRRKYVITQRRAELMAVQEDLSNSDPIEQWATLLIQPLVELIQTYGQQGHAYVRLMWRCNTERPEWVDAIIESKLDKKVTRQFSHRLADALPNNTKAQLRTKGILAARLVFSTLAMPTDAKTLQDNLAVLKTFVCAGLRSE